MVGADHATLLSLGYQQVGKDFPVFLNPKTKEEYALAEQNVNLAQVTLAFICDFSPTITLEQDLIRRDLTINAMAQSEDGEIIDPYGGKQDLENQNFTPYFPRSFRRSFTSITRGTLCSPLSFSPVLKSPRKH